MTNYMMATFCSKGFLFLRDGSAYSHATIHGVKWIYWVVPSNVIATIINLPQFTVYYILLSAVYSSHQHHDIISMTATIIVLP